MTTEAGKLLLEHSSHLRGCAVFMPQDSVCDCGLVALVAAIEAEAIAARNTEIAEAVRGLPNGVVFHNGPGVGRAAVLAIVEPKP